MLTGSDHSLPIKTVLFKNGHDFLRHFEEMDGEGGLVVPSKLRYHPEEQVVLEIFFPPMPNRLLIRAEAVPHMASQGFAAFRFLTSETLKKNYLVRIAKKNIRVKRRRDRRYPTNLEVTWRVDGVALRHPARLRDLSRGGLSLTTEWPPPVGTDVVVHLDLPGSQNKVILDGRVTWTTQTMKTGAMGIQFFTNRLADLKRLRRFLHQLNDSGVVPTVHEPSRGRRSSRRTRQADPS